MAKLLAAILALTISVVLFSACGGHGSVLPVESESPNELNDAEGLSTRLPDLGQLPEAQRELSIVGPGFFEIPLDEMVARGGTAGAPGSLTIGTGGLGYAIYGVFGFDGDNGPTSARITASSVSGQYFVGFSDYVRRAWNYAGPFTDSAEVEIPNTDEYTSPTAYTSPGGTCYLAVICSAGDSATLTGVELGVHGGTLGPEPPLSFDASGTAGDFFLAWTNSASYHDPDVAGYILQRAPLLGGNFENLSPNPISNTYFNDATAEQDTLYRYRVCTEDVSSNRSIWRNIVDGPVTAEKAEPVVNLDLPLGPLYGPIDVAFDLGDSFDPEGEGITTYSLNFLIGPAPVSGPNSSFNVLLEPGCYLINAEVECAGPPVRSASNVYRLVVYPRWEETPAVINDPVASTGIDVNRLLHASGTFNSAAQRLTFCGIDVSSIGLSIYSAPASNPADLSLTRLPVYYFPGGASDALDVGTSTYYAYSSSDALYLQTFDGTTASQQVFQVAPATGSIAAAYDGSQIWLFYGYFDGLNTNLDCLAASSTDSFTAVAASGALTAIDALYNPDTGTIDVVYGSSASATTEWVRVDTATETVVDSANLDAIAAAVDIDLELDPATGRPIVMYSHTAIHRFRELDELNVWTPEVQVDNAIMNYVPLDLIVDDGTRYAYFRTGPANQAVLYRDDGGAWSAVNTVGFSADSGYEVALVPQPGSADRALVLDRDALQGFHLAALHDDGTDTDMWQLPASDGQGFELHAASSSGELHAVWTSLGTFKTRHYASVDGATWLDQGDIGTFYQNLDLASDFGGNLYFSGYNAGSSELYWWDGLAFNLRASFAGSSAHRPFFSNPDLGDIVWCAYDNGATTMHYVDVDEPVYADTPVVMTTSPIWDGVSNTIGMSADYCLSLVGGANATEGTVNWSEVGDSTTNLLYDPLLGGPFNFYTTPVTAGRFFASTSYVTGLSIFAEQAIFCTRGQLINPARYTLSLFETPQLDNIIVGEDYSLFNLTEAINADVRFTASCDLANSLTGLVLISSGDGANSYFAWSRWGDWEELPLPAGVEHMSMPELVVGDDGRWHIVYKNWRTDQMMCISTVAP